MISPALENTGVQRFVSGSMTGLVLVSPLIQEASSVQEVKLSSKFFTSSHMSLSLTHTTAKVCLPCPVFFVCLFVLSAVCC